jgi:FkbM family methyltransferase
VTGRTYPYVAPHRRFDDLDFDFLVADPEAANWYDSDPDQRMPEREWCRAHVRPGDVIVDCGAHHGLMTVLFGLWTGPSGRVVAYEALPFNADIVRENVRLNRLANVEVRPVGVSDRAKRITAANIKNNIVIDDAGIVKLEDNPVEVELVRLDDDTDPGFKADFVKFDVEGSDLQAITGAQRILRSRPTVDLELHNFLFEDKAKTLDAIFQIMNPSSYRYEILPEVDSPALVQVESGLPDLDWLATYTNPHVFCLGRASEGTS